MTLTDDHVGGLHFLLQLVQPVRYPLMEGLGLREVEDQQRDLGVPVVQRHNGSEPLVARRVPDVELDLLAALRLHLLLLVRPC